MKESGSIHRWRYVLQGLAGLLLAILCIVGYNYLNDPERFPVRVVTVTGELRHVTHEAVQAMVGPYVTDSFISIDINGLREILREEPWVREAQVKRVWPNTLAVTLEEHEPVAYWGEHALVSDEGQAFSPTVLPELALPRWEGPPEQLSQVREMHTVLNRLLADTGVEVAALSLNARFAWHVVLSSGLSIELGSHDVAERFERFVRVTPIDIESPTGVRYVDLRYTNGFVINAKK